ncbi:MAG: serine hydrolase, partial [Gammaproteobacteria bacterium]
MSNQNPEQFASTEITGEVTGREDFTHLLILLQAASDAFWVFALYDSVEAREAVISAIKRITAPTPVFEWTHSPQSPYPFDYLKKLTPEQQSRRAIVFFFDLERGDDKAWKSLDYFCLRSNAPFSLSDSGINPVEQVWNLLYRVLEETMKKQIRFCAIAGLLLIVLSWSVAAQSSLTAAIDEMLAKEFKANEPGAAAIVVKDGKVVFRKGYGMANLELGVAIEPDMIFRIGSVTKQFTAVATLMLAEQGKLSLTDEITKFLPDYPTQGRKITIEHLLTHTSGIVSYTGLPEWRPQMRKDVTLDEMIAVFKDKPMEFAPGERWNYNNSGYVLLGAVIEKASGMKYADFVEKNIFAPLGMKRSFYDSTSRIIPRRAAGYSKGKDGYVNAEYLSMSWPHAAGSLISTVDDLALWDAALYTDKIVKQESLKRAWKAFPLNDGRPAKYGYGWGLSTMEGHPAIGHGGGINGFTCDALRLPDDRVYVAILTNRDAGTGNLT